MSPYPTITPTEEEELAAAPSRVMAAPPAEPPPRDKGPATPHPILAPRGRNWLGEAMLEMSPTRPPRRTWDFFAAFALEAAVVIVAVLIPLIFTQAIDLKQLTTTYLVAPPPPPSPPPPPAAGVLKARSSLKRVFTQAGRLIAPTAVPAQIAMLKEEALPPDISAGAEGGVPGGVPGGQVGGVLGGVLQESAKNYPPIAPPTSSGMRRAPLRVGGNIKAPQPLYTPYPPYPVLARQARIQGDVLISAVIDATGSIVEMKVISGQALLLPAALEAVSRWKYQPTILNGEPVAVELIVTVHFRLDVK